MAVKTQIDLEHLDWASEYRACGVWGPTFSHTLGTEQPWPLHIQFQDSKMFYQSKLCIPQCIQGAWIRYWHANAAHPIGTKMWDKVALAYEWADLDLAWKQCQDIPRQCETFQATKRPHSTKGPPLYPIPDQIMSNVALDLFRLPRLFTMGKTSTPSRCTLTGCRDGWW